MSLIVFLVGTILRCFIAKHIYLVIIGQFFNGFASSFIANLQIKVISEWFDAKEVNLLKLKIEKSNLQRGIWITLSGLANPLGSLLSNLLPVIMITINGTADKETNKTQIQKYLIMHAIICGVICLITILFWKQGYSKGSIIKLEQKKQLDDYEKMGLTDVELKKRLKDRSIKGMSVSGQIKDLLSRKYIVLVILNYSFGFGMIIGVGALLTELIYNIGYDMVRI